MSSSPSRPAGASAVDAAAGHPTRVSRPVSPASFR